MDKRARHTATNNRHLSDRDLLEKGMNPRRWKVKVDNKMRGAFGETDFATKTIRINKRKHKVKKLLAREKKYHRLPDGTESILDTMAHEMEHVRTPKENSERKIEARAQRRVKKMSTRGKKRLYALIKR